MPSKTTRKEIGRAALINSRAIRVMATERNESKNKMYIGRVTVAAGGKTETREGEGLVVGGER